jgi:hypothetical protein
VARRHSLQAEVREKHNVELEVFDGLALAENLADHEIFWIAEEYLSIPATYRPEGRGQEGEGEADLDQVPDWYRESRDRWVERATMNASPGELSSVTDGLRHATFTPEARGDIEFWLDLVRPLATAGDEDCPPYLRQRARYEVAVAEIRGRGFLRPADEIVRAFLRDARQEGDATVLEDSAVILSYAGTAVSLGHSDLGLPELADANKALRERIAGLLADQSAPVRRARLLHALGHLALIPDPLRLEVFDPDEDGEMVDTATLIDQARAEGINEECLTSMPSIDIEVTMAAWSELAGLLEDTPLFPVEAWARQLEFLAPALVGHSGWAEIEDAVDAAIARLHGGDAAAVRARDRAVRLQEAGRLRAALGEFQKAKMRWWNGDSLRGALLCMLGIAEIYRELRLPLAGKQYALAVAVITHGSDDEEVSDLLPKAAVMAAEMDYAAGVWAGAVELADVGLMGHAILIDADENPWVEHDLASALMTIGMALRAARGFRPELVEVVEAVAERHGMLDELNSIEEATEDWSEQDWTRIADEQLLGRPFSDLGRERIIRFAALGTIWTVRAANDVVNSRAAERLAAAAQLLLVELADDDLCLIRAMVEVTVEVDDGEEREPQVSIDQEGHRRWAVTLRPVDRAASPEEAEEALRELMVTLSTILLDISLLPTKEYLGWIERAFERGLAHKLAIGRPYEEMAEIVPASNLDAEARRVEPPFGEGVPGPEEHPELDWQDGPGPTYDAARARQMLETRYARVPGLIPCTLNTVRTDERLQAVVATLRERGWLDWHILTGLANVSVNARLAARGLDTREAMSSAGGQATAKQIVDKPEQDDDPVISAAEIPAAEAGRLPRSLREEDSSGYWHWCATGALPYEAHESASSHTRNSWRSATATGRMRSATKTRSRSRSRQARRVLPVGRKGKRTASRASSGTDDNGPGHG